MFEFEQFIGTVCLLVFVCTSEDGITQYVLVDRPRNEEVDHGNLFATTREIFSGVFVSLLSWILFSYKFCGHFTS